ncbi:DUF6183 family protein [Streptomyces sp. 150FB]|uniref:DUF6183 family protein n=1 Tax=Streptomyces sp. 150FB TaxID=1576605 RepID=UPI001F2E560A|nr:DUF6183 family protein [Streptomyces sp. 150FB]
MRAKHGNQRARQGDLGWQRLLAAASTGGAYNRGCYGAHGRLNAWRSVAALSGTADGSLPDEVERQARESARYGFRAATKWSWQVAWDIGLVTVARAASGSLRWPLQILTDPRSAYCSTLVEIVRRSKEVRREDH